MALAATCLRSLSRRGCRPCRARNEVSRPLIFADIGGNAATGERMRCSVPAISEYTVLRLRIISLSLVPPCPLFLDEQPQVVADCKRLHLAMATTQQFRRAGIKQNGHGWGLPGGLRGGSSG
jgi:hypothetical protein